MSVRQFDRSDIAAEVPISVAKSEFMERLLRFEQSQLSRGLMRTDGGGPDTPFDMHDILRHFQDIAFYDEYDATIGFKRISKASHLVKWTTPVRFNPVRCTALRRLDSIRETEQCATASDVARVIVNALVETCDH